MSAGKLMRRCFFFLMSITDSTHPSGSYREQARHTVSPCDKRADKADNVSADDVVLVDEVIGGLVEFLRQRQAQAW